MSTTMTNQRIIYSNTDGTVAVIVPTGELPIEAVAAKDVPAGLAYEIVTTDDVPSDRTFRGAWVMGDCCIDHDLDKCKAIGHDKRRAARAAEFAPLDEVIAKQIPGVNAIAAEASRQVIRDKYAEVQESIDAAETPDAIKAALGGAS
jgi:hypothetical protein